MKCCWGSWDVRIRHIGGGGGVQRGEKTLKKVSGSRIQCYILLTGIASADFWNGINRENACTCTDKY